MRRLLPVLLLLMTAFGAGCGRDERSAAVVPSPAPVPPTVLAPRVGERSAGELVGRDPRRFTIEVPQGWFLEVSVEQQGIDLAVTAVGPGGEDAVTIDSPTGDRGAEILPFVAAAGGRQALTVAGSGDVRGRFELRIVALRRAGDRDRARAAAAALDAKGAAAKDAAAAEKLQRQALVEWQRGDDPRGEALTWRRLGEVERRLGALNEEVRCHQEALRLIRETGDRYQEVRLLSALGTAEKRRGRRLDAETAFRSSRAAALALGDRDAEAIALGNLAGLAQDREELARALVLYDQAIERMGPQGEALATAQLLHNRGSIYRQLNRLEEAQDSFYKALALRREIGDAAGETTTLLLLGQICGWRQQHKEALRYLRLALQLARERGDLSSQGSALDKLGQVYLESGRLAAAVSAQSQAAALWEGRKAEKVGLGWLEISRGRLQEALGQKEEALQSHRRAQIQLGALEDRTGVAAALYQQALLLRDRGEPAAALAAVEEAVGLLESLRADAPAFSLESSYLAPRQGYRQLQVDLLMRQGRPESALEASERSRARGFLEALATSPGDLRRGAPEPLLAEAKALAARINALEQKLQDPATPAPARGELESGLRLALLDYDKLQARLRSAPSSLAVQPLTVRGMQALLDADTLFLVYALGGERSHLWVVDRTSVQSFALPPRATIEALSRRAWDLLSHTTRGGSQRSGRALAELGEAVLAPAAARLGKHRLAIVADGALRDIPFAALPVPGSGGLDGRRLVEDHEIVVLESASVLSLLRKRFAGRPPAPLDAAVLADPVYSADDGRVTGRPAEPGAGDVFPRLPATLKEAELLASLLPPARVRVALDFAADRELVLSGALGRYRILHFATHGGLDPQHPELSSLILSLVDPQGRPRDGRIRAYELFDLDLPADLTVLSACRTLPDARSQGERVVEMARGFMVAGSPRVVVSLWNVNDTSTAVLMEHFYRGILERGLRPAAALREAQIALLADHPFEDPFHWAPFVLQGDWR